MSFEDLEQTLNEFMEAATTTANSHKNAIEATNARLAEFENPEPGAGLGRKTEPGPLAAPAVHKRLIKEDVTPALRADQSFAEWAAARPETKEYEGLTLGKYLRAMALGPKSKGEVMALTEGSDSAGGYTVPEPLSGRLIDLLRKKTVVFQAGAMTVPLTSDVNHVAKVASDPTPAWRSEEGAVSNSEPTFARVTFTPRSLAVLVKVSFELLEDSVNVQTQLPRILASALALELDRVALLGSGTPPEPEGIVNFAGLTTNGFAGGALSNYTPLITARTALREANSDVTAYVMSARDEGAFAGLTATDDQPLMVPPAIANVPRLATTAIPTDGGAGSNESQIVAGDFSRLMIGMRSQMRVEVLRERYAENLQIGYIAHLRADVAAEHEAAFTTLDAITP